MVLLPACGTSDRDLIVERINENNGYGIYGIELVQGCLKATVEAFPQADIYRMAGAIRTGEDIGPEALTARGQLLLEQVQHLCIDLNAYRESQIAAAAARNADMNVDCLRAQYPVAETFDEMRANLSPAVRFCGGTN